MKQKEEDFTQFVARHKHTIYSVCLMFSQDEAEVEDLVQEVLINLWQGMDSFRGDSRPGTWLWRISLNTCLSTQRRTRRRAAAEGDLRVHVLSGDDDEARQIRQLHRRIRKLLPLDRAIVLLWLEDLSYDEIAAIVGISTKNVSVRLVRIREQLKRMSNQSPTSL